jgi:insulysin
MGTSKYPRENEYSEFISNNSGEDNAFTSESDTNYTFEILSNVFEAALEIFSQFFVCPLFN